MKFTRVLLTSMAALVLISNYSAAQDNTDAPEKAKPLKGRLPNYYRLVGLQEEQVQTIYRIQADYATQLDALERQMEELKAKRDIEVEGVLTEKQLEKLSEVLVESKRRREERAKKKLERETAKKAAKEPTKEATKEATENAGGDPADTTSGTTTEAKIEKKPAAPPE